MASAASDEGGDRFPDSPSFSPSPPHSVPYGIRPGAGSVDLQASESSAFSSSSGAGGGARSSVRRVASGSRSERSGSSLTRTASALTRRPTLSLGGGSRGPEDANRTVRPNDREYSRDKGYKPNS